MTKVREVLDLLAAKGPMTCAEIAAGAGIGKRVAARRLCYMVLAGYVVRDGEIFSVGSVVPGPPGGPSRAKGYRAPRTLDSFDLTKSRGRCRAREHGFEVPRKTPERKATPLLLKKSAPRKVDPVVEALPIDYSRAKITRAPSYPEHRFAVTGPVPRHFSFEFERAHFERVA